MNRNFKKALLIFGTLTSVATTAMADDWVTDCLDPTTATIPYSSDWGQQLDFNDLFGAAMGVSGTVNFSKVCFPPNGVTLPMAGRVGFMTGATGSTQDNIAGTKVDDFMGLTFGMFTGVSGNFSIAKFFIGDANGQNIKSDYFGKNAIDTTYFGASDRYFVGQSTNGGVRIQLRVDIIGDTARCDWRVQNQQTTAATVAMWFGQWVIMNGPQGPHSADWIVVPGLKPMSTDHQFVRNANPAAVPPQYELPPYINYGMFQSNAYGLQVVLNPNNQIPDQTPCDALDVGKNGFLLGSMTASDGAMPDVTLEDTTMQFGSAAYIQKWNATPVTASVGGNIQAEPVTSDIREIVAYYRSTWSTSDYAKPYSVVLDAPPVVGTVPNAPQNFSNAPFSITIDIDNTRGFSTVDKAVPLQDVQVTLSLPQGMSDANDPTRQTMSKFINSIAPRTIQRVTFQVGVDPRLFGAQQYTVTVTPNPGAPKVLTGSVVVASQPFLRIGNTANLVSAPWKFSNSVWPEIIGKNSGLVLDADYQVFGWDALSQSYILQTGPQRGFGSFIVSSVNADFIPLGGNPQQVDDLQIGAPQVILHSGWNMIANPYNYAFEIGDLVGVPESDNQNAYTFQQLAEQNVVSGFLASWDPLIQGYKYTTSFSDLIQPNTGYWVFVQSDQDVVLNYPPVFQSFLPGLPDPGGAVPKSKAIRNVAAGNPTWALQLAASSNGLVDSQTYVGQAATAAIAKSLTRFKPPVAPLKKAVGTSIEVTAGKHIQQLGRALTAPIVGTTTWKWNVSSVAAGNVTLTWPTMSLVPNNVQVKLVDLATGASKNMRTTTSYTFAGKAKTVHPFQVVVQSGPALPVITSVAASAATTNVSGSYLLSVNAKTTVSVVQGGQTIATLITSRSDSAGTSKVSWNYLDSANRRVRPGIYQMVVNATPSGGTTETKSVSFVVSR